MGAAATVHCHHAAIGGRVSSPFTARSWREAARATISPSRAAIGVVRHAANSICASPAVRATAEITGRLGARKVSGVFREIYKTVDYFYTHRRMELFVLLRDSLRRRFSTSEMVGKTFIEHVRTPRNKICSTL